MFINNSKFTKFTIDKQINNHKLDKFAKKNPWCYHNSKDEYIIWIY